jgi:predicted metal-dependent phosphoesterase TrpH
MRRINMVAGIVVAATATTINDTGSVDQAGFGLSDAPIIPPSITITIEPVAEISWQITRIIRLLLFIGELGQILQDSLTQAGSAGIHFAPYNRIVMIYDLHTHSTASDGSLTPDELLAFAVANGVDAVAITDHDTLDAYAGISACRSSALQVVPGIELSTTWNGRGIHVVGLNINIKNDTLLGGIARQKSAREKRARTIAERLQRFGVDDAFSSAKAIAGDAPIGRPHFAQHLVSLGLAKDTRAAFRKFLGAGKPGDVKDGWASLEEVIHWIRAAGGTAVLAHPAKYRMTNTKLGLLLKDFRAAGGSAMEVVTGHQAPNVTAILAQLAMDFGLAASCGSDFHDRSQTWSLPGRFTPLPSRLTPVWNQW